MGVYRDLRGFTVGFRVRAYRGLQQFAGVYRDF